MEDAPIYVGQAAPRYCWMCGAQTIVVGTEIPGKTVLVWVLRPHEDKRSRKPCIAGGVGAPPRQRTPGERGVRLTRG